VCVCVSAFYSAAAAAHAIVYILIYVYIYIVHAYLARAPGYVSRSVGVHAAHYTSPISFMVPRTPTLASSIWIVPPTPSSSPFGGTAPLSRYPPDPSTVSPHTHPVPTAPRVFHPSDSRAPSHRPAPPRHRHLAVRPSARTPPPRAEERSTLPSKPASCLHINIFRSFSSHLLYPPPSRSQTVVVRRPPSYVPDWYAHLYIYTHAYIDIDMRVFVGIYMYVYMYYTWVFREHHYNTAAAAAPAHYVTLLCCPGPFIKTCFATPLGLKFTHNVAFARGFCGKRF